MTAMTMTSFGGGDFTLRCKYFNSFPGSGRFFKNQFCLFLWELIDAKHLIIK